MLRFLIAMAALVMVAVPVSASSEELPLYLEDNTPNKIYLDPMKGIICNKPEQVKAIIKAKFSGKSTAEAVEAINGKDGAKPNACGAAAFEGRVVKNSEIFRVRHVKFRMIEVEIHKMWIKHPMFGHLPPQLIDLPEPNLQYMAEFVSLDDTV